MRYRTNGITSAVKMRNVAIGCAVQLACPEHVEIAGAAGFDFVYIDCEHGSFFLETAVQMIRAAEAVSITPVVRVPDHEPSFISRILDAGAMGVIVPNIATAEEARRAISAARYRAGENRGSRGACPGTRASYHQTSDWPAFVKWSNEQTIVWLLIESPEGIANLDEILEVPGFDAVMLGPFDLAHAMGHAGEVSHPAVLANLMSVVERAKRRNVEVVASLFSADPGLMGQEKQKWLEAGARILVAGSDRRMLVEAMRSRAAALIAELDGPPRSRT